MSAAAKQQVYNCNEWNYDRWLKDLVSGTVIVTPPKGMRIEIECKGFNKLENGSKKGVLFAVSPDTIVIQFEHRNPNAVPRIYCEPYDTVFGEREVGDPQWCTAIPEDRLTLIKALAKRLNPNIKFPDENGVYS